LRLRRRSHVWRPAWRGARRRGPGEPRQRRPYHLIPTIRYSHAGRRPSAATGSVPASASAGRSESPR